MSNPAPPADLVRSMSDDELLLHVADRTEYAPWAEGELRSRMAAHIEANSAIDEVILAYSRSEECGSTICQVARAELRALRAKAAEADALRKRVADLEKNIARIAGVIRVKRAARTERIAGTLHSRLDSPMGDKFSGDCRALPQIPIEPPEVKETP